MQDQKKDLITYVKNNFNNNYPDKTIFNNVVVKLEKINEKIAINSKYKLTNVQINTILTNILKTYNLKKNFEELLNILDVLDKITIYHLLNTKMIYKLLDLHNKNYIEYNDNDNINYKWIENLHNNNYKFTIEEILYFHKFKYFPPINILIDNNININDICGELTNNNIKKYFELYKKMKQFPNDVFITQNIPTYLNKQNSIYNIVDILTLLQNISYHITLNTINSIIIKTKIDKIDIVKLLEYINQQKIKLDDSIYNALYTDRDQYVLVNLSKMTSQIIKLKCIPNINHFNLILKTIIKKIYHNEKYINTLDNDYFINLFINELKCKPNEETCNIICEENNIILFNYFNNKNLLVITDNTMEYAFSKINSYTDKDKNFYIILQLLNKKCIINKRCIEKIKYFTTAIGDFLTNNYVIDIDFLKILIKKNFNINKLNNIPSNIINEEFYFFIYENNHYNIFKKKSETDHKKFNENTDDENTDDENTDNENTDNENTDDKNGNIYKIENSNDYLDIYPCTIKKCFDLYNKYNKLHSYRKSFILSCKTKQDVIKLSESKMIDQYCYDYAIQGYYNDNNSINYLLIKLLETKYDFKPTFLTFMKIYTIRTRSIFYNKYILTKKYHEDLDYKKYYVK